MTKKLVHELAQSMLDVGARPWLAEAIDEAIDAKTLSVSTFSEAASKFGIPAHEQEKSTAFGAGGRMRFNAFMSDLAALRGDVLEVTPKYRGESNWKTVPSAVSAPIESEKPAAITSIRIGNMLQPEPRDSGDSCATIPSDSLTVDFLEACLLPRILCQKLKRAFELDLLPHRYRMLRAVLSDVSGFSKTLFLVRGVGSAAHRSILREVKNHERINRYLTNVQDSSRSESQVDLNVVSGPSAGVCDGSGIPAVQLRGNVYQLQSASSASPNSKATDTRFRGAVSGGLADSVRLEVIRRRLGKKF